VVERSAVNRLVVGSNPTSGAIFSGEHVLRLRASLPNRRSNTPSLCAAGLEDSLPRRRLGEGGDDEHENEAPCEGPLRQLNGDPRASKAKKVNQ
jgi:hypothetical protein